VDTIHAFYRYVLVKAWVPEIQEPQVCARPGKHKSQKPRNPKFVRDQESTNLRNPGSPSLCETRKQKSSEIQGVQVCARHKKLRNPRKPRLRETREQQTQKSRKFEIVRDHATQISEIQETQVCVRPGKHKTQKSRKIEIVRAQETQISETQEFQVCARAGNAKLRNPGNPSLCETREEENSETQETQGLSLMFLSIFCFP